MQTEKNGLHIFGNDSEYVIARDVEDAYAVFRETYGQKGPTREDIGELEQWPDHKPFDFDHQDKRGAESLTGAEWAQKNGRGYFASADY